MILAIPLVFLIGGFLGWLYGRRSVRNKLIEPRRLNQLSLTDKREKMRSDISSELPAIRAAYKAITNTLSKLSSTSAVSNDFTTRHSSSTLSSSTRLHSESRECGGEENLDDLYKFAGRIKPLEYDLTQRKLEVKALKQALQDVRCINEKRLVSVRLQAENRANLQNKAKLADKQNEVDSLRTELSDLSVSKSTDLELQAQIDRAQLLEDERDQLQDKNESQLVDIQALTERASKTESQNQALQAKLAELERARSEFSGSIDHFSTQIDERDRQLDNIREKYFLADQKNIDFTSLNARQTKELTSTKQQLVGTLENLTQSEKRVGELQKEVSRLNQRLNNRANELEAVQLSLKESCERRALLAERVKSVDAHVRHEDELSRKLKERDHDMEILIGQLNEANVYEVRFKESLRDIDAQATQINQKEKKLVAAAKQLLEHQTKISELKTELKTRAELIKAQKGRLDKIPSLEASALESEQELIRVQERVELVGTLQQTLMEKDAHIAKLRKQSKRLVSLESAVKTRDTENRKLSERSAQADELEKQLSDKDRRIVTLQQFETKATDQEALIANLRREYDVAIADKMLSENSQLQLQQELAVAKESASELIRVRTELVSSRKLQAQLAEAQDELIKAKLIKADHDSLKSVSIELEQSRVETKKLSHSLKKAELAVANAKQNDIEVRRLRSEVQSLYSIRDNLACKVQSLEKKIQVQERQIVKSNQLNDRVRELESAEGDKTLRDQQIIELKDRLHELGNENSLYSDISEKQSTKTKSSIPQTPLYTASAAKDDLKKINGIGPVMEKMLNSLGVTSFKQVAEFKAEDISTVTDAIDAFPGRIERDDWVGGAKEQYAKKYHKADA